MTDEGEQATDDRLQTAEDRGRGRVLELTVNDVAYRGRGVARHAGCVVFVAGVLPGERVAVQIIAQRRNFAEGRLVEVLTPSPQRVPPGCPLAIRAARHDLTTQTCPGCAYQHAAYAEEVRIKQAQFGALLRRLGGLASPPLLPPAPAPACLSYRNKILLHADAAQPPAAFGYIAEDNCSVVDVPRCPLAIEPINALLTDLRGRSDFREALAPRTRIVLRYTEAEGALWWVASRPTGGELTERTRLGPLHVPRASFSQVNPAVADLLLAEVSAGLARIAPVAAIDLYCGAGLFALAAAMAGVSRVTGVDSDRRAIQAARQNARERNLNTIDFRAQPAAGAVAGLLRQTPPAETVLIVDPPRQGLEARVAEAIARGGPRHVLYISCAPDTLSRDLRRLSAAGYRPTACRLFDMFPRTAYFETATWLLRA